MKYIVDEESAVKTCLLKNKSQTGIIQITGKPAESYVIRDLSQR